ncbi:protein phosphatase 1 regulatory subunit 12A isoform X2 [Brienomyrus brachyistius]|uniref:protein phosphatase 1 regulatory subunit 12A isoform X2 n=1 Tax=Brienomyrus brachyistius TaxID=42636 RepID=UPI0020B2A1E2|nr:protein phosphatase 1 regulatory subunit 12A isoform X2 [Brienomyrus brachyistius]
MAADDRSRSEAAKQRRHDQLQRWLGSETDRTGTELRDRPSTGGGRRARVRFAQGAVFMAACSAGDREEVSELLKQGADINHANVDGLTALHQACIDENIDMVQFLVENGSEVNRGDNEGWTPLHAAASCGFIPIAKFLIDHGALVGAVNSEGELPLDVATEDAMDRLLKAEIKKQGVDMESARREEERVMLRDAMAISAGRGTLTPHSITGATTLHVAAAKGYMEVMKVLFQCGLDVDCKDCDGWTPLHAAAHWGQEEACSLLAENMCDMGAVNIVGQTPLDVADENLVDTLEELQKKQNVMRSERQKLSQPPIIETSSPVSTAPPRARSKEKISLHERERHPPPPLQNTPNEDEEEDMQAGPQGPSGASSSSSSEEDSESESDAESEKAKTREIINNKRNTSALSAVSTAASATATQSKKPDPGKPPVVEAPGSWRTSLRKSDSSVALGGGTEPSRQGNNPEWTPQTMTRSASSPRLSSESDAKVPRPGPHTNETRLARVPPTPSRRLFSITDNNPPTDTSSSGLTRSSSYTRRFNSQSASDLTGPAPGLPRSSSYGKKLDDPMVTSVSTGNTSGLNRLNSLVAQRLAQEQADKRDTFSTTTSNAVTLATAEQETKQRRKSYLTPVRDEEAEAQRKARSRHARQSRRSTQGVTLTDLQEAEKTIKTEQTEREKKKEEDERDTKQKKADEGEVSWRSRIANLQKSDLLGLTTPAGAPRPHTADGRDSQEGGTGLEDRLNRERRTRVRQRAAQRTGENDDNELSVEEEGGDRGPVSQSQAGRNSSRSGGPSNDCIISRGSETKDYKRLFEEVSLENSQLQSQLQDTQRTVSQTRADLDKATQRQERFSDCSALLELEKKERRLLERRVAELEEELKVLGDLRADNQRLKDENGALIRVISKLSK